MRRLWMMNNCNTTLSIMSRINMYVTEYVWCVLGFCLKVM